MEVLSSVRAVTRALTSQASENLIKNESFADAEAFKRKCWRDCDGAKAETATLAFSDWESPAKAGGEPGEELILNAVRVRPYFAE